MAIDQSTEKHGIAPFVIADNHDLARAGLRSMLANERRLQFAGEAENGREAVELCTRVRPRLVLMDLYMPVLNGIDATRQIIAKQPQIAVLVLTMAEGDDSVFAAMRAGESLAQGLNSFDA